MTSGGNILPCFRLKECSFVFAWRVYYGWPLTNPTVISLLSGESSCRQIALCWPPREAVNEYIHSFFLSGPCFSVLSSAHTHPLENHLSLKPILYLLSYFQVTRCNTSNPLESWATLNFSPLHFSNIVTKTLARILTCSICEIWIVELYFLTKPPYRWHHPTSQYTGNWMGFEV